MSYAVFFPYNCPTVFIFSQPDKPRMPQVTIRRPFGELDLNNQISFFGQNMEDDNQRLIISEQSLPRRFVCAVEAEPSH
jgi:hypothetical protein